MVKDIREVTPDEHWEAFEELWTGLMSYRYLNTDHSVIGHRLRR